MFYHQVYAQILNKKVKNIVVFTNQSYADYITKNIYGKDAIAIECTYWDCRIGDIYEDNEFKEPETKELRHYKGTEAENIEELQIATDTLKQESIDTNETLLDTQFELELAKDEIVDNMEAQLDLEFRVSQLEDNMEEK